MTTCKPVPTPSVLGHDLQDSPILDEAAHHRYRRVVGKLIWSLPERPDLAQAVVAVARKVQQPTAHDMVNLKRIVRYVMGTLNAYMELRLNPGRDANTIELYSDASWASTEQRRSVSGIVVIYKGVLMGSWSRTQHSVTHSSCESEIVAAHETVCEGKLLMHMIEEALPTERGPRKIALLLNVDAQACERFMMRRGPGTMRHLDVKMVSIQDDVRDGVLKERLADRRRSHEAVTSGGGRAMLG